MGAGFVAGAPLVGLLTVVPAGAVDAGVVVGAVPPLVGVPEVLAGVEAGVGNDVNGVGSGGRGFARIPATSSVNPLSESALRYLYQVVRLSFQTGFCAVNLESVPASATALA